MPDDQLVAVAVCPHPPLLLPDIARGAAPELDDLREACDEAVRRLVSAGADRVLVVGAGVDRPDNYVDYRSIDHIGFGQYTGVGEVTTLPLSLAVAGWLLRRVGLGRSHGADRSVPAQGRVVAVDAPPSRCAAIAADLIAGGGRTGLLVMGDGSARRTESAPGHFHPEAEAFDNAVADALGTADLDRLRRLDPELASELLAVGRAPWQVLAGAAGHRRWNPELLYHAAPYGVGYLVASWT